MRHQRKQHFIDSHVQGSLLKRILMHWLAFFSVACLVTLILQTLLGDPTQPIMERMKAESGQMIFMAIILLSLFPAFMLDTIRFSNRFVGPITRLRRVLREFGENEEVEYLKFRDNDFWADVASDFNKAVEHLRLQREEIARLEKQLQEKETASC